MLAEDPAFERAVKVWERRLTPLSELALSAEPPADLWQRISQSTAPKADNVVPLRRLRFWQASTAGALAAAAALAAFVILRQSEPSTLAVLTPISGEPAVLLATSEAGAEIVASTEWCDCGPGWQRPRTLGSPKRANTTAFPWSASRRGSPDRCTFGGGHAVDGKPGASGRFSHRTTDRPGNLRRQTNQVQLNPK